MENDVPDDLIGLAEATRLVPCAVAGKRVHVATLTRWVLTGKLRGWRIAGRLFVSRADLRDMARPVAVKPGLVQERRERKAADKARERWTRERLAAHGIKI